MHVSVIIPNYNHARFLEQRMRSVLDQTWQDFDIIILDDHSTDGSAEVIERYRNHPKVSRIVVNEENSGSPFRQWHKGIGMAEGELVWIAESDDSCDRTFLERNVGNFLQDGECVLSVACSARMDENGDVHETIREVPQDMTLDGMDFNQKYMYCGCFIVNASSAVFRRDVALRADPVYLEYKGAGDRVFWMEIAKCGNVAIIRDPLNHFRKHGENTTRTLYRDGTDYFEAKRTYDFIRSRYSPCRKECRRIRRHYLYRIRYVERFRSEEVRKALLKVWKPGWADTLYVDLRRLAIRILSS